MRKLIQQEWLKIKRIKCWNSEQICTQDWYTYVSGYKKISAEGKGENQLGLGSLGSCRLHIRAVQSHFMFFWLFFYVIKQVSSYVSYSEERCDAVFSVKLQKCFVDYKPPPDFPSAWREMMMTELLLLNFPLNVHFKGSASTSIWIFYHIKKECE